eukprot:gene12770-biopygen10340
MDGASPSRKEWGLELDPQTMVLKDCKAGSIASTNARIMACRGLRVQEVNMRPMADIGDWHSVVKDVDRLSLVFAKKASWTTWVPSANELTIPCEYKCGSCQDSPEPDLGKPRAIRITSEGAGPT